MAFDESLAGRIRDALARKKNIEEKKMFGCICFLINGNALAGVWKDRLIARIGLDEAKAALREPHVRVGGEPGRGRRVGVPARCRPRVGRGGNGLGRDEDRLRRTPRTATVSARPGD